MNSQSKNIIEWLERGNSITPILALEKFGCFRLGARIWDLRKMGYNIESKLVGDSNTSKKHWAQYSIVKPLSSNLKVIVN